MSFKIPKIFWQGLWSGSLIALLGVWYTYAAGNGDFLLYMPLVQEFAYPGTFHPQDILVAAGMRNAFHLYELGGWIYRYFPDFEWAWFWVHLLFMWLYCLSHWTFIWTVSRSALAATLGAASMFLFPNAFFLLGYGFSPPHHLVSQTAAIPFAVFACATLFQSRYVLTALLLSVVFAFHPGLGLIIGFTTVGFILAERRPWKESVWLMALTGLSLAPNAITLLLRLPGNWSPTPALSTSEFFDIFYRVSGHAYIQWQWRETATFFLGLSAGLLGLRQFPVAMQRRLVVFTALCLAYMLLYTLNVHLVRYAGATLIFGYRASIFLKPLFWAAFFLGVADLLADRTVGKNTKAFTLFCLVATFFYDPTLTQLGMFTLFLGFWALQSYKQTRFVPMLVMLAGASLILLFAFQRFYPNGISASPLDLELYWGAPLLFVSVLFTTYLLLQTRTKLEPIGRFQPERAEPKYSKPVWAYCILAFWGLLFCRNLWVHKSFAGLLPRSPAAVYKSFHHIEPEPEVAEFFEWIKINVPAHALVFVPPNDERLYPFRALTRIGTYTTTTEINQIAYDLKYYKEAYARLQRSGCEVDRVRGQTRYACRTDRMTQASFDRMRNEGVTFAIFEKTQTPAFLKSTPTVFTFKDYLVFDLSHL